MTSSPQQEKDARTPEVTAAQAEVPEREGLMECEVQPASAVRVERATTRQVGINGRIGGLVVDRAGVATLAWSADLDGTWGAWTVDEPGSPAGPTRLPALPPKDLPEGATVSDHFASEDSLGIDSTGTITAMWLEDVRLPSGDNTEFYDLALADRGPDGDWSAPTVLTTGFAYFSDLAVNADGAGAVLWTDFEDRRVVRELGVRERAHGPWVARGTAPGSGGLPRVGIDDEGGVSVVTPDGRGLRYSRRSATGAWTTSRVGGPKSDLTGWAASAGGSAVIAFSRGPRGHHATLRMSRSGTWSRAVRQPGGSTFPGPTIDIDASGRALWATWDRRRLITRSSGPFGRWRRPCVLAEHIAEPHYYDDVESHVVVNRQGDAVAIWRTKVHTSRLWVSYRPVGEAWTQPTIVTTDGPSQPGTYRAAIGDDGHAAVAWLSRDYRQLTVVRLAPTG